MVEAILQSVILVTAFVAVAALILDWLNCLARGIEAARDAFRVNSRLPPPRRRRRTDPREVTNLLRKVRRSTADSGIVIVAAEEAVEGGRCPVCRTPLGFDVRRCRRCRTPHHAECWTYFGGCAVFACDRRGRS